MKKNKDKKVKFSFNSKELISILLVTLALGILLGSILTYKKQNVILTSNTKELDEFIDIYNNISNNNYKKISKNKLIDAAIEGMINSLDDQYAVFMDKDDAVEFSENINGEYTGIGITINVSDGVKIVSVFDNSPASSAGIKKGDKIIEINNKSTENMTTTEIASLIKDSSNYITLKIIRTNKEHTYKIKKATIDIPSITSKIFNQDNKKIGYLAISIFSNTSYEEFSKKLSKLEKNKIDALIIDVRNNPGGHLSQVNKILDIFLAKGKVLYQIKTKSTKKVYASNNDKRTYGIAVLINNNSASASEILSSAIKESYNGIIIGQKSYGKGSVQQQYNLEGGSSFKYTVKKWLTPKGKSIDKIGVEPDIIIEQSDEYYSNKTIENDTQLQEAIKVLKEKIS